MCLNPEYSSRTGPRFFSTRPSLTTLTSTKSTLPTTLAWWSRPSENDKKSAMVECGFVLSVHHLKILCNVVAVLWRRTF